MATSRVKRDNYIVVQGWMIADLGLKGNELIIYACIYGFSQAEDQVFSGSLQYLADWTNSTKQGVMKCLKSLVEKGYIAKNDKVINGVKFCEYRATEFNTGMQQSCMGGIKQSLPGGMQQSLPNNISSDKQDLDKKDNKKYIVEQIVEHLNEKAGTAYRASTKATQQHINARLSEGFTVEDFFKVIDSRCAEWMGDPKMAQYLRPSTLFGPKFENYLNTPTGKPPKGGGQFDNLPGMQII